MQITSKDQQARNKWQFRGNNRPPFATTPGPDQESVWDYPRPPLLAPDSRHILVRAGDKIVAESTSAVRVLETASPPTFYIPANDVALYLLNPNERTTRCEWKGVAREYDMAGIHGAAWSYFDTIEEFDSLNGYFGFYPSKLDCFVDYEKVVPQTGGYYGGWITKEIVGPFKSGDTETSNW